MDMTLQNINLKIIGSEDFVFDGKFHWDGNQTPSVQQCLKDIRKSTITINGQSTIFKIQETLMNHILIMRVFVEKVKQTIEADEDPDETKFELEEESEISSDSC